MTTTITKLDNDTGLPVLPEDLFWRIKEEKLVVGDNYVMKPGERYGTWVPAYQSSGTVKIELVRVSTKEIPAEAEVVEVVKKRFWGIFPYRQEVVTIEARPARTDREEEVISSDSLLEIRNKPANSNDYEDRDWTNNDWEGNAWKATPPTHENIRELSSKVWNGYITEQHTLALAEDGERELAKFIGDYPPKNLNTVA